MIVAQTAAASSGDGNFLIFGGHVCNQLAGFGGADDGSDRDEDEQIVSVGAVHALAHAGLAFLGT